MPNTVVLAELYKLKISVVALREIIKQIDTTQVNKEKLLTNIPQSVVSNNDKQAYKSEIEDLLR